MGPILNEKQKSTVKKIDQFLSQSTEKIFYLLGYAGTGKTFLMGQIIKELLATKRVSYFYICAPTHQALDVIESSLKSNLSLTEQVEYIANLNFMTVQKLLEFRPVIMTDDGSKVFKSTRESKFLKQLDDKLIVIDECSMISTEMMTTLKKYINIYPIKIIFMGDRKQLPPVNESESQIFLSIPKKYNYYMLLDEIMRTKSPEIKKVCKIIRDWNQKDNLIKLLLPIHNENKSFRMFHKKPNYTDTTWFKTIVKKIATNDMPIILTWKNATAEYYNDILRKYIHKKPDLNNFMVNDYVIFNNYYKTPDDDSGIFYTSKMVRILEITEEERFLYSWNDFHLTKSTNDNTTNISDTTKKDVANISLIVTDTKKTLAEKDLDIMLKKLWKQRNMFKINILVVEKIYRDTDTIIDKKPYKIQIIHKNDFVEYTKMLENTKSHIKNFCKKYESNKKNLKIINKLWEIYHDKFVSPFAEIKFGYAVTTHKAQGSTFESVFVDIQDIDENPDKDEMQRALYTAAGRASTFLSFLVD